jgi:hypothetical protein
VAHGWTQFWKNGMVEGFVNNWGHPILRFACHLSFSIG